MIHNTDLTVLYKVVKFVWEWFGRNDDGQSSYEDITVQGHMRLNGVKVKIF